LKFLTFTSFFNFLIIIWETTNNQSLKLEDFGDSHHQSDDGFQPKPVICFYLLVLVIVVVVVCFAGGCRLRPLMWAHRTTPTCPVLDKCGPSAISSSPRQITKNEIGTAKNFEWQKGWTRWIRELKTMAVIADIVHVLFSY